MEHVSPYLPVIIFVGFLLSVAVGLGFAVVVEAMDQSIRGEKELAEALGAAPMMSVPYIYLDEELTQHNKTLYYSIGAIVSLGLIILLMIHAFVKPLDVIWFILLRKFGLN